MGNHVPDRTFGRPGQPPPAARVIGAAQVRAPRRVRWALAGLLLIPLLELLVAVAVGRQIGAGWTILLLLALTLIGSSVVRRAAASSVGKLQVSVAEKRVPGGEIAGQVLLILAGLLLAFPGFVTGVLGLLLLLPPVRAVAGRRWKQQLAAAAADRAALLNRFGPPGAGPAGTEGLWRASQDPRRPGEVVITGEVIEEPPPGDAPRTGRS